MSWDQVRELVGAGIACQPHTHTHPILTRVDPDRLADELTRSSRVVSEQTGRPTPAFAYPNGSAADFDETVTAAVAAAGYDVAITMEPGPVHRDTARRRPLEIARVPVVHTDTLAGFQLKTMGWTRLAMRARERRESIAQRMRKPA